MSDEDAIDEEMIGELLLEADRARDRPAAFFEFVMREEIENLPIHCAPHQAVILEFVTAHQKSVVMIPFGHSKTYTTAGLGLFVAGTDPLLRGAIVSASQSQAEKPVGMVRQYVEGSPELRLVFPDLRPTQRRGEPWTTTDLTFDRPPGIRDPSFVARGLDSKSVLGSRWKRVLFDDVLNDENTRTPESREKTWLAIRKTFLTRLDPVGGWACWVSTAWDQDDCTHRLMRPKPEGGSGWPALVMRADGFVYVRNTTWTTPLLRTAIRPPTTEAAYRLVAHDPDDAEETPLWPARYSREALEEERTSMHPALYNQLFLNECRDDSSALCRQEYVDRAFAVAVEMKLESLVPAIDRSSFPHPIFVGVDLAFSKSDGADESAIFVMAVLPDPKAQQFNLLRVGPPIARPLQRLDAQQPVKRPTPIRVPLWIEHGRWGAEELYRRLVDIDRRFQPYAFAVENNAAQESLRQLMSLADKSLVLRPHRTDATKNSIAMGVPSLFGEFANGAWAFPHRPGASRHPALHKFITQCLNYSPSDHTGDLVMAAYFARDLARKWGVLAREDPQGGKRAAANVMVR